MTVLTFLAVSPVVAVSAVTASPLKLNPPSPRLRHPDLGTKFLRFPRLTAPNVDIHSGNTRYCPLIAVNTG